MELRTASAASDEITIPLSARSNVRSGVTIIAVIEATKNPAHSATR